MEVAIPIPALAPILRALGGECVEGVGVDVDVNVGVDVGVDADTDAEGVEDSVILLLMDEVTEDDVIGLDSACIVKDSGEGA